MKPKAFKRRNFISLPKFQYKYAFFFGGISLTIALLQFAALYTSLSDNYYHVLDFLLKQDAEIAIALSDDFRYAIWKIAIVLITFTTVITISGIFLTHTIAGPIWKIKRFIRDMIDSGDYSKRISFRKDDEFKELATVFNELLEKVEKDTKK